MGLGADPPSASSLSPSGCQGDKVALPGWRPCPANCPLSLRCNWRDGGALGQSRRPCSGEELPQQQRLHVGVYCSLSHGPCAGTALAPLYPGPARGLGLAGTRTTLGRHSPGPPTHLMGLRSGHLPLHHPFLCFLSMLNASLPCVGAG